MSHPEGILSDLQNTGPVYVYEYGHLHSAGSRPKTVGRPSKRARPLSPEAEPLAYHQIQHAHSFNVAPLMHICIEFVAENISIVESLVDFPDIVGKELFNSVCRQNHLKDHKAEKVEGIVRLFSESYKDSVLSVCNLSLLPRLMLEDCSNLIGQFLYLYKLDVGDHQLGDDHVLWATVARMTSLCHLCVKNNSLSDRGLQQMTLPSRMYGRGPVNLHTLILACNPAITDRGIRYLMCFTKLQHLDLSGTSVKAGGVRWLGEKLHLEQYEGGEVGGVAGHQGWLAPVMDGWLDDYRTLQGQQQLLMEPDHSNKNLLKTYSFYNSKKSRLQAARALKEKYPRSACPPSEPHICLQSRGRLADSNQGEQGGDGGRGSVGSSTPTVCGWVQPHTVHHTSCSDIINLTTTGGFQEHNTQETSCDIASRNTLLAGYVGQASCSTSVTSETTHTSPRTQAVNARASCGVRVNKFADKQSENGVNNDIDFMSLYGEKKTVPNKSTLWSAMHSNQW